MILGTAAYMSPEQAKGRQVDKRTDIFAFGCVLFEMLTGKHAFEGDEVSDILASVLAREPDLGALPPNLPTPVRTLVQRCLEKDRIRRVADISIALFVISEQSKLSSAPTVATPRNLPSWRRALPWAATAVMFAGLALLSMIHFSETTPPAVPEMRVEIHTPETRNPFTFALSPDGRRIVFSALDNGTERLWLRALDSTSAEPLAGTERGGDPFWSADSRSIGFWGRNTLFRLDLDGGRPQALVTTDMGNFSGGTWNAAGRSFSPEATGRCRVSRLPAASQPRSLRSIGRAGPALGHLSFFPMAVIFCFYAQGTPEASGIYLATLDGGEPKRLTASDTPGAYLEPDHVVFVRLGALVARRLDVARGERVGDPVKLADSVLYDGAIAAFSVSSDGSIAYRSGAAVAQQLTWFDRMGRTFGVVGAGSMPELSPDGERVAVQRSSDNAGAADVWLMDLVRGNSTRFTSDAATDIQPIWSPEGTKIVFISNRKSGILNLYMKRSNGSGAEELLLETPNDKRPQDWSRDGRYLLYRENDPKTGSDLGLWRWRAINERRELWSIRRSRNASASSPLTDDGSLTRLVKPAG